MDDSKIVVGQGEGRASRRGQPDFAAAWRVVGMCSWVFMLVGGIDLFLALVPLRFGSPEWEFGTASVVLDNLPLFTVGLVLQAASAAALGGVRRLQVLTWLMPVMVLLIGGAALLYTLALPLALAEVTEPGSRVLLLKASTKTAVQALSYLGLFVGVFLWARRSARG